jgi:hypothetical protein
VAGVGDFETRSGWRVRVAGDFNLTGVGVFFYPPPGFPPAAIPILIVYSAPVLMVIAQFNANFT